MTVIPENIFSTTLIKFPEFCNMMADKMNAANDEDMIRMAFRVLDKDGSGTISAKSFTHLMTHIGTINTGIEPDGREQFKWFLTPGGTK